MDKLNRTLRGWANFRVDTSERVSGSKGRIFVRVEGPQPRERPGLPGLGVLDPYAARVGRKGREYRPASAATITNINHIISVPCIHVVSRKFVRITKRATVSRSHARAGSRSAKRPMAKSVVMIKTMRKASPTYPMSSIVSR